MAAVEVVKPPGELIEAIPGKKVTPLTKSPPSWVAGADVLKPAILQLDATAQLAEEFGRLPMPLYGVSVTGDSGCVAVYSEIFQRLSGQPVEVDDPSPKHPLLLALPTGSGTLLHFYHPPERFSCISAERFAFLYLTSKSIIYVTKAPVMNRELLVKFHRFAGNLQLVADVGDDGSDASDEEEVKEKEEPRDAAPDAPRLHLVFDEFTLKAEPGELETFVEEVFQRDPLLRGMFSGFQGLALSISSREENMAELMYNVVNTMEPAKYGLDELSGSEYVQVMSMLYQQLAEKHLPEQVLPQYAQLCGKESWKLEREAFDQYVCNMESQLQKPLELEQFRHIHALASRDALQGLQQDLRDLGVSEEDRRSSLHSLAERLRAERNSLADRNAELSYEECYTLAQRLWDDSAINSLGLDVVVQAGEAMMQWCAEQLKALERRYFGEAVGPGKEVAYFNFICTKAKLVEDALQMNNALNELSREEQDFYAGVAETLRDGRMAELQAVLSNLQAQQEKAVAELNLELQCYGQKSEQFSQAMAENLQKIQAASNEAAQGLVNSSQSGVDGMARDHQASMNEVNRFVEERVAELEQAYQDLGDANQSIQQGEEGIKEIKAKKPWWCKVLQACIGGVMCIGGLALTICTGGAGGVLGGMLMSAGLGVTVKSLMSKDGMDWKDFGIAIGVGLATGLIGGGLGAAAGSVANGLASGLSVGSMLVHGAIHGGCFAVSGALSSFSAAVLENACRGGKWDSSFWRSAGCASLVGAAVGFAAGGVQGMAQAGKVAHGVKEGAKQGMANVASAGQQVSHAKSAGHVLLHTVGGAASGAGGGALEAALTGQDVGQAALTGLWMGAVGGCLGGLASAGRMYSKRAENQQKIDRAKKEKVLTPDGQLNTDPLDSQSHLERHVQQMGGSDSNNMHRVHKGTGEKGTGVPTKPGMPDMPKTDKAGAFTDPNYVQAAKNKGQAAALAKLANERQEIVKKFNDMQPLIEKQRNYVGDRSSTEFKKILADVRDAKADLRAAQNDYRDYYNKGKMLKVTVGPNDSKMNWKQWFRSLGTSKASWGKEFSATGEQGSAINIKANNNCTSLEGYYFVKMDGKMPDVHLNQGPLPSRQHLHLSTLYPVAGNKSGFANCLYNAFQGVKTQQNLAHLPQRMVQSQIWHQQSEPREP